MYRYAELFEHYVYCKTYFRWTTESRLMHQHSSTRLQHLTTLSRAAACGTTQRKLTRQSPSTLDVRCNGNRRHRGRKSTSTRKSRRRSESTKSLTACTDVSPRREDNLCKRRLDFRQWQPKSAPFPALCMQGFKSLLHLQDHDPRSAAHMDHGTATAHDETPASGHVQLRRSRLN